MKIFAGMQDIEKAQQKAELKTGFSDDFLKELEGMGISGDDIEGMRVRIEHNGDVAVDGIEEENIREQVWKLIDRKYGDQMYQYGRRYIFGFAVDMRALEKRLAPQSFGNMYSDMYQYQFRKVL